MLLAVGRGCCVGGDRAIVPDGRGSFERDSKLDVATYDPGDSWDGPAHLEIVQTEPLQVRFTNANGEAG